MSKSQLSKRRFEPIGFGWSYVDLVLISEQLLGEPHLWHRRLRRTEYLGVSPGYVRLKSKGREHTYLYDVCVKCGSSQ